MIPWVIEYENGIKIIARNAGMASSNLFQLIFVMGFIIKTPTITKAGAVAIFEQPSIDLGLIKTE